ncbi:hypothetical protein [Empedobacter sedimenti]|uniref:hypothetical protein n=1 Tax=Empedobacter sedimenti TaxID=3042610 RepID=UPI0024A79209|nr:hypothetical protein [Empedobacter sedimenti]
MLKVHCIPNKTNSINAYIIYVELLMKLKKNKDSFFIKLTSFLSLISFILAVFFKSIVLTEFGIVFLLLILGLNIYYYFTKNKLISNFKKHVNSIPEEEFKKEFDIIFEEDGIKIDTYLLNYNELRNFVRYKHLLFIEKNDNSLFNVIFSNKEIDHETYDRILDVLANKDIKEFKHKFTI